MSLKNGGSIWRHSEVVELDSDELKLKRQQVYKRRTKPIRKLEDKQIRMKDCT